MGGFIVSLLAQIGLEDVSGSDLINETTILYFLPMTNAGLEPGGYLEVMLQQVLNGFIPMYSNNNKNKMFRFPVYTGAPWQ